MALPLRAMTLVCLMCPVGLSRMPVLSVSLLEDRQTGRRLAARPAAAAAASGTLAAEE